MASKEYYEEQSKFYYENFINHKCTKKVRGIIINEMGQILLLHSNKHNGYSIPGGKVEDEESIRDTVIREVYEEVGAEIIPIKIVGKYYHTSKNFNYDGIVFDSDRVEYFYFCKFKGFKNDNLGLKGEFDDGDVERKFLDYEDVMVARLLKRDKSMIERAMNEFLLYKADEESEFDGFNTKAQSKKR
jgi:8-oxo-dGTP pyrophosphatase MutT (NUDIX family)